jgi:hypothetical protein
LQPVTSGTLTGKSRLQSYAAGGFVFRVLILTDASFRRSNRTATTTPIAITANVAARLPDPTQLMQVPMIDGASYMTFLAYRL